MKLCWQSIEKTFDLKFLRKPFGTITLAKKSQKNHNEQGRKDENCKP